jgi:hypothetical protein
MAIRDNIKWQTTKRGWWGTTSLRWKMTWDDELTMKNDGGQWEQEGAPRGMAWHGSVTKKKFKWQVGMKGHQDQWQGVGVRPKNIYRERFVFKEWMDNGGQHGLMGVMNPI